MTPCHAWHLGPDATLLIIWSRQRMWTAVYLVFLQACSWSHLASPQISKVIVITATPCHVWHLDPDATLLIIWRRWRVWSQVYLVLCTATPSLPPPGSMCSSSPVQTPHSAHSVQLLLLLMLIVPLYFIAIFAVREKNAVNRISTFEKWLSPPIRSKCPMQKSILRF